MAYTPKQNLQDDNEQQQQVGAYAPAAPTISGPSVGTTASFGGTQSGNSAAAPQQNQDASPGTGFVNIDRYLQANQGEGKRIAGIAGQQRKQEGAEFDKQAKDFEAGVKKVRAINPTAPASSLMAPFQYSSPGAIPTDQAKKELGAYNNQMDSIGGLYKRAMNQTYTGPSGFDATAGSSESENLSRTLSNPLTAAAKLATMNGAAAAYNPQMSAIDQAILTNQQGDLSRISTDQAAEMARRQGAGDRLNSMADNKKAELERAATNARGGLLQQAASVNDGSISSLNAMGLKRIGAILGDQSLIDAKPTPRAPIETTGNSVPTYTAEELAAKQKRDQNREAKAAADAKLQADIDKQDARARKRGGRE